MNSELDVEEQQQPMYSSTSRWLWLLIGIWVIALMMYAFSSSLSYEGLSQPAFPSSPRLSMPAASPKLSQTLLNQLPQHYRISEHIRTSSPFPYSQQMFSKPVLPSWAQDLNRNRFFNMQ